MHKQVIPPHKLAAARAKLWKTYGPYAAQFISIFMLITVCVMILFRCLYPVWTVAFLSLTILGLIGLWFACFPQTKQVIMKNYRMWQLKRDIRNIIRSTYGYATEKNVDSINRVVKTIMDHSDMGEFRAAPKDYYNLISLNPVETAAIYGDSYVSFGRLHFRLPLAG